MKMSKMYLPTLKEVPSEAEVLSHQYMLRAGMMRTLTAGVYSYLPLGYRVIRKIENIIRKAMDESGAQELLMPIMHTAELWQESGRWDRFGPLMIKFQDRKGREYCLGPTHEEIITDLVRDEIRSYKDLPLNLYQIQTKVRDEIRPRFGIMRGREFIMKDAYSFDTDYEGLDKSYQLMYDAYVKAFKDCGLEVRAVEADSGAMGGSASHEFMVLADAGEDEVAFCNNCDYAANVERAEAAIADPAFEKEEMAAAEKVYTPAQKTIAEITEYLNVNANRTIKSLAFLADGEPILVLLSGNDELNEIKLANYLNAVELEAVVEDKFPEMYNSFAGFIGPVGIKEGIRILADLRVKNLKNAITGANEKDYHLINVNPGKDFEVKDYLDLRKVKDGDQCPHCEGQLEIKAGIEVGHIFKLGSKYSESMGARYLDENGREQLIIMGSYGIGITRLVAAAIEQQHDENGIIWPTAIAPYQVIILPLGNNDEVTTRAEVIYQELTDNGIEVLLDDRQERAGVKFNDADLIGIPLRLTIGSRSLEKGVVEARVRKTGEEINIKLDSVYEKVIGILKNID
ncbi:proline--tRNA ligase [Halocella sp. SP3-1]|uniref:proline--tRNA ligase n=1 Tax=Halocella sp. SP3-1 TaxID=2382161 RepID=UPI000F752627|nr:proline--tRNA ligase [Halocella sp. SP3-1]AZO95547.1 proline--tRNA ligase [Halocella sp. SP3-1]